MKWLFFLLSLVLVSVVHGAQIDTAVEVIGKGELQGRVAFSALLVAENVARVKLIVDLTDIAPGTRWTAILLESFDSGNTWLPVPRCGFGGMDWGTLESPLASIDCHLKQPNSKNRQLKGEFEVLQGKADTKVEVVLK